MKLSELQDKSVFILGFGEEGRDTYLALREMFPSKVLAIADKKELSSFDKKLQSQLKKDKNVELYFANGYLEKIGGYDVIIRSPGIADKVFKHLLKEKTDIASQTELFFDNFDGLTIGVTGTKGKGTTSSLIYSILKASGKKAHLVGNIGKPVLQTLLRSKANDIFVYELSSHQLQDLKRSPHIAVFLNLYSDHLDYYKTLKEYQGAKANITLHQKKNNFICYNRDDKLVQAIVKKSKAKKVPVSRLDKKKVEEIIPLEKIPLIGDFNFLNIAAAVEVAKILEIPQEKIRKGLEAFKPLKHRLEFVAKYKGIEFYDDSMSTIPDVAVAAINALKGKSITLIAGGSEKGSDYQKMAESIVRNEIKHLVLLGSGTSEKIYAEVTKKAKRLKKPIPKTLYVYSMKHAVESCFKFTEAGGVCLLSPGSASFNLFGDYKDRGNQFKKWVRYYGK